MNFLKLFDSSLSTTNEQPTTLTLANTISIQPTLSEPQQEVMAAFDEELWFNGNHKAEARQLLEGALIAYQHRFDGQVQLYKNAFVNLAWKDVTGRVRGLLSTQLKYSGLVYTLPDNLDLPTRVFSVPIDATAGSSVRYEWQYMPLNEFNRLIPPHALKALSLLEQNGISPMAYWVADKIQVSVSTRVSVDPLLVIQLGRNFCAVAEWR